MNETAAIFLTLGLVLGLARVARAGAHLLHVPQVSILMLAGLLSGPMALDLVPESVRTSYPTVAEATLAMVGFSSAVGCCCATWPSVDGPSSRSRSSTPC